MARWRLSANLKRLADVETGMAVGESTPEVVRRPSRIHVNVSAASGEISGVKVGGPSVIVGEGSVTL